MSTKSRLAELIPKYEAELLRDWIKEQLTEGAYRPDLMAEDELKHQSAEFLGAFRAGCKAEDLLDVTGAADWEKARIYIKNISRSRANQGFTPSETATFVFSLKKPIFSMLHRELEKEPKVLLSEMWTATALIDKFGLMTVEAFIKGKEEIIKRQRDELLELSTPVVKLWDRILAVPLIGTLDSARTQVVMENLLQEIVSTSSSVAIIDITGVPTVDTLVAQHLLKTVSAARLMGAECIVSGIRPQIAQTMVHLGVSFSDIITKASLADAIRYAFDKTGIRLTQSSAKA